MYTCTNIFPMKKSFNKKWQGSNYPNMKRVSPKWRLAQMSTCWFLKQWYHIDGMGPEVPFKTLFWLLVLVQSWDSHFHIRVGEGRWGEWCPTCFHLFNSTFSMPITSTNSPPLPTYGFSCYYTFYLDLSCVYAKAQWGCWQATFTRCASELTDCLNECCRSIWRCFLGWENETEQAMDRHVDPDNLYPFLTAIILS